MSYADFFSQHVHNAKLRSSELSGCCPFHDDRRASFSANIETGLWKCHAGCGGGNARQFAERLGVEPPKEEPEREKPPIVARYVYQDEKGQTLFRVCRTSLKGFFQERYENGQWPPGVNGVRRVPYRLPEILKSPTVYVVEGEKDADRLWSLGIPATTNPGGAGKWRDEFSEALRGKKIVIIPDNDRPGIDHAQRTARSLIDNRVEAVKLIHLPDLGPIKEKHGEDVSDWLDAGHTKEELAEIVRGSPLITEKDLEISTSSYDREIKLETLGDLWRKEIPTRESFLGDGLIARGDLIVFSGPQKKGKSIASLNQALCLARGESWLGLSVLKPVRVGIVQQEIPEGSLKERLQKMLGLNLRELPFLDSMPHCSRQGLKLDTKDGLDFLRRWLDSAKVDLLQLDPLYTFHGGDENSARDMGRFFSSLQEIVRHYSIAVMVIHHHGKPGQVEREGGDLHRGSSLLRDATDANWTFTRVPANKLALPEPPSRYVYLSFEQRHSASPDPLLLHLDPETLWFERVEAKEVREVKVEEIVEELVTKGGESLQDDLIRAMVERLGARERSTRDAIYEARDKGLIEGGFKDRKRVWRLRPDFGSESAGEPCQGDFGRTPVAKVD